MARHTDDEAVRAERKLTFLARYREVGEVLPSCEAADISRRTYNRWMEEDERFREDCRMAKQDSVDSAVLELRRRATGEAQEPWTDRNGNVIYMRDPDTGELTLDDNFEPVPLMRPIRSDRLLEVYVKAHRREYRDKGELALTGADGGPVRSSITVHFVKARDGRRDDGDGDDGSDGVGDGDQPAG